MLKNSNFTFQNFLNKKIYIHVERRALQLVFNKILTLLWKRARIQKPSLSICAHFWHSVLEMGQVLALELMSPEISCYWNLALKNGKTLFLFIEKCSTRAENELWLPFTRLSACYFRYATLICIFSNFLKFVSFYIS